MENIKIKDEDISRLIIDLLIKNIAETQALREFRLEQLITSSWVDDGQTKAQTKPSKMVYYIKINNK